MLLFLLLFLLCFICFSCLPPRQPAGWLAGRRVGRPASQPAEHHTSCLPLLFSSHPPTQVGHSTWLKTLLSNVDAHANASARTSASASASASAAVVGSAATMSSAMAGASEASTFLRNAAGSSQALVSNPLEARDWFAPMTAPMMPSAVAGPPPPLPFVVDDEDMDIGDAAVVGGGSVGADVLSASMISFGFGTASPIATPRIDGPVRELAMSGESLLPSTVGTAAAGDGGGGELENSLDVLMASIGM